MNEDEIRKLFHDYPFTLKGYFWGLIKWKCYCGEINTSIAKCCDGETNYKCPVCERVFELYDMFVG